MANSPTFIIIGAARCGTTALYTYLRQHPKVFMSRIKEPNHFAFVDTPLNYQGPGAEFVNNSVIDQAAYDALFADAPVSAAVGEASPLYMERPQTAAKLHERLPDAKLIAILRNPVEQVYSHYLYARKEMVEPLADFNAALDAQPERLAARWQPMFQYVAFARYAEQLKRFLDLYPREQLKVVLYEDFAADPVAVVQELYAFLGVDPTFAPDVSHQTNAGGAPKNEWLQALVMRPNLANKLAAYVIPHGLRRRLRDLISSFNTRREAMPAQARRRLQAELKGDILALQDLIGRDLSAWMA